MNPKRGLKNGPVHTSPVYLSLSLLLLSVLLSSVLSPVLLLLPLLLSLLVTELLLSRGFQEHTVLTQAQTGPSRPKRHTHTLRPGQGLRAPPVPQVGHALIPRVGGG